VGYFFGGETWTRILTEESFFGCVAKSIVTLSKSELATKLKVYLGAKKKKKNSLKCDKIKKLFFYVVG
jgi:hypothetical protein